MSEKQTNQERLKEITERIEAGIRDILESGDMQKYQEYLRTMSRFHRYSVNNQMLIHLQCPNATLVAGYSKWEKQFSRHVMQGEKGITIIAPTPYKKKIEQEKLDPDTKLPLLDENGDVILEEKEIKIPMFRPVKVFDYSQTDGKPLPEHVASPVAALTGDVENYAVFMEALRRSSPVPIQIKSLSSGLDGFFSPDTQSITLREGMSQVQTVCAAVHELAHARLHNYKKPEVLPDGVERGTAKSRSTEEVEAESISFMVCAYFGIETSENSFGYVASWSKDATIPEFRASLDTIGKTANAIITDVETHFPVICKERGIELPHEKDAEQAADPQDQPAQPEVSRAVEEAAPEAVPEIAAPPDPGMSIAAMNAFGYTDADMLPLSKERALELLERDVPVYMLMEDNAEAMAFEPEDIEMHTGMFGITRQDWESVRDSVPPMDSAVIQERREQAFLNNPADSYAIFQLKNGEEQRLLRFVNTDYLRKHGLHPEKDNGIAPGAHHEAEQNHFTCRTYKKDGAEVCSAHYIREVALKEIVLETIRRATEFARSDPERFAAYIQQKQSTEVAKEIRGVERELSTMRKRDGELDVVFKRMYEDSALGRVSNEQFRLLSEAYSKEKAQLAEAIPATEERLEKLRSSMANAKNFIAKARKFTDMTELTPELLRTFVEKIIVYEKEVKYSKHAPQKIHICFRDFNLNETDDMLLCGETTEKADSTIALPA